MSARTTIVLDDESRRAAKALAKRLDVTPSEAIGQAVLLTCNGRDSSGIEGLRLDEFKD